MFHRKRGVSNPARPTTPSAAASTAAAQAFLASKASNTQLSNAAAAAALRSYTTTPTPVGDVQTKRMVQRHGSVSSTGSANVRPAELQRKNSSGSMTERTFREPSPNRGTSSFVQSDDAPPVPALPRQYASPPPVPAKSIRRPASVEPPERMSSPNPRLGGRGVSLDRGPGMLPLRPNRRSKQQGPRLDTSGESNRSQTRDSVNFSRPMSPYNSPPISPSSKKPSTSLTDQSASAALTAAIRAPAVAVSDTEVIRRSIQNAANRPVKKNKKVAGKGNAEGSHFSQETRPIIGSSAPNLRDEAPADNRKSLLDTKMPYDEANEEQTSKRKKKKAVSATHDPPRSSYGSDSETQSDYGSSSDFPRTYNTRAARLLAKQPSVVREDRAAEEKEDRATLRRSDKEAAQNGSAAKSGDSTSSRVSGMYQHHNRSTSEPVGSSKSTTKASTANTGKTQTENLSVKEEPFSPARAAHFSNQLVLQTPDLIKHQPPARSVSPAKSALKHSPSSRGPSPLGMLPGSWTGRNGRAASEASDTASAISDDGSKSKSRKKSVRVSFDEETVVVGRAASPPPSPDSPMVKSPQDKRTDGQWAVTGRNRKEDVSASDPDVGNVMQPTPALPSFGSIRDKSSQSPTRHMKQKVAENSPESMPNRLESSTDQIIGRIFSQDYENRSQGATSSVPHGHDDSTIPTARSTEGRRDRDEGDLSDKQTSIQLANGSLSTPDRSLNLDTTSATTSDRDDLGFVSRGIVPSIAILPATPGIGDYNEMQSSWLHMPGGFPVSTDSLHDDQKSSSSIVGYPTPAQIGIAEPEPEPQPIASRHEVGFPAAGHVAEVFRTQLSSQTIDEDTESSSIYSDAAEDLSDLEGDGFGSINAIVESPVRDKRNTPKSVNAADLGADSLDKQPSKVKKTRPGTLPRNESELSEPGAEEGWDRAQEYWSGLSQDRKAQLERAAARGVMEEVPNQRKSRVVGSKPAPKTKSASQEGPSQENPPFPPWPEKQRRKETAKSSPPVANSMKQSMRNVKPEDSRDVHLHSSLRTGDAPPLPRPYSRNSTQSPDPLQPKSALRKKTRPASSATMDEYETPKIVTATGHLRAASAGPALKSLAASPASPAPPKLGRVKSNDSDSSSSFKKARTRATDNGRYTMKRSMRGGSAEERPQSMHVAPNSSFDGRPLSPSGLNTRRPFSSSGPIMRSSLRGSMDAKVETRTKSPSRFGFGKASKSQPKKNTSTKWSSRFADSSDEDDGRQVRRSRFVDSSDDEDMAPVRGIPRRIDEGDSTELEDSPVETSPPSKTMSKKSPDAPRESGDSNLVESGQSPYNSVSGALASNNTTGSQARIWAEKEKKKRSFFGALGKRKNSDSRVPKSEPDSPAQRDTPPERPRAERPRVERVMSNGTVGSNSPATAVAPASPKSPKLQRRNTPKRFASDSWPLPAPPMMPGAADDRPNTSDGNGLGLGLDVDSRDGDHGEGGNGVTRPELGSRRSTQPGRPNGVANTGEAVPLGIPGSKKKRFPLLRKALGLHD